MGIEQHRIRLIVWKPVVLCRADGTSRFAHALDADGGLTLFQKIRMMPRQRPISLAVAWALRSEWLREAVDANDWEQMRFLQTPGFLTMIEENGFHVQIAPSDILIVFP